MNILSIKNLNLIYTTPYQQNRTKYRNLEPLQKDTVTFGAIKKNSLNKFDLACAEMFKAPLEQFTSTKDMNIWAQNKFNDAIKKYYQARTEDASDSRETILEDWKKYLSNGNSAYTPSIKLIIFSSIVKNLTQKNDSLPPSLNPGVLADTVEEMENRLKENPKASLNFNKIYQNKLMTYALGNEPLETGETETKWIKIPSKEHDSENFDKNVEKLKILSHKSWCTKSYNARPYLEDGDFHIYLESGQPKLGVRFVGDKIEEIQGEKNNGTIPIKYVDILKPHIIDCKFSDDAAEEIKKAEKYNQEVKEIKNRIKNPDDPISVFEALDIGCKRNEDGTISIDEYRQPSKHFLFEDIGVDENKLMEEVSHIEGNAVFRKSKIKSLPNLVYIGGDADFKKSQIKSLPKLETINGRAKFESTEITSIPKLKNIGHNAYFSYSKISSLPELTNVKGIIFFSCSDISYLPKLTYIGRGCSFRNTKIKSIPKLEYSGDLTLVDSQVEDIPALKYAQKVTIGRCPLKKDYFEGICEDIETDINYW